MNDLRFGGNIAIQKSTSIGKQLSINKEYDYSDIDDYHINDYHINKNRNTLSFEEKVAGCGKIIDILSVIGFIVIVIYCIINEGGWGMFLFILFVLFILVLRKIFKGFF